MNRFEDRVHTERRESGELSVDAFATAWLETQADLLGDSVELADDYGVVVVLRAALHRHARATSTPTPTGTCSRCRSTAATSRRARASSTPTSSCCAPAARCRPRSSAQIVGVDLTDPGFWDAGLDLIERQLEEAEEAARESGAAV